MNTYEQQVNLAERSLATFKNDGNYTTFKYARKVMHDYLWFQEPSLLECRGHVYDNLTKAIVQAAPRKSFNYLERRYWSDVTLDTPVRMFKKINGFMACATLHNNKLVVSTTGTTTSEYAQWARLLIERDYKFYDLIIEPTVTALFEVVVPQDPHIVQEREGLHLLGAREKATGKYWPMGENKCCTLEEAIKIAEKDRGEGFMVFKEDSEVSNVCKLKTPYYTGKKKLMRMSAKNVEVMYNKTATAINALQLPGMWQFAPQLIMQEHSKEVWSEMSDQNRRKFLENIE